MATVHEARKRRERERGMLRKTLWLRSATGTWYVHPDLRGRLIADAEADGTNMNEVARRALAARYGVPYVPSPIRRTPGSGSDSQVILTLDLPLVDAITLAANRREDRSFDNELRHALCAHYGLRVPARPRRRRTA